MNAYRSDSGAEHLPEDGGLAVPLWFPREPANMSLATA